MIDSTAIIETILKFVLIILGKSTSGINPYVNLLCGFILVRQVLNVN